MSPLLLGLSPRPAGPRPARLAFAGLLSLLVLAPSSTEAQEPSLVDDMAEAIAESLAPRWVGPRTPWPEPGERPEAAGIARATYAPAAVRPAAWVHPDDIETVRRALDVAHDYLEVTGWPTPIPDGGYGDTAELDVYLTDVAGLDGRPYRIGYDAPVHWTGLDATDAYVVIDPAAVDPARLEACAVSAYTQAALLSAEPAEARAWRAATGDYVAFLLTGIFGCEDRVSEQQHESHRTWIGHEDDSGEGGALFLAMLSLRTDGLSGRFIRDLWSGAAQLTWEGRDLRAAPDLWQVVHAIMEIGDDPLPRLIEEMAVARYFFGLEARTVGSPMPALALEVPESASVPLAGRIRWEDLPRQLTARDIELEPFGSAYVEVDTASAPPGSQLRIWLRGEDGVGWSLVAVRVGEDGVERGRTRAPVQFRMPRSFIPLELVDGETAKVILVITNMGERLVDADVTDDQVRSFRVVVDDRAEPSD